MSDSDPKHASQSNPLAAVGHAVVAGAKAIASTIEAMIDHVLHDEAPAIEAAAAQVEGDLEARAETAIAAELPVVEKAAEAAVITAVEAAL